MSNDQFTPGMDRRDHLIRMVRTMRKFQKEYFATRKKSALICSKKYEQIVDQELQAIEEKS